MAPMNRRSVTLDTQPRDRDVTMREREDTHDIEDMYGSVAPEYRNPLHAAPSGLAPALDVKPPLPLTSTEPQLAPVFIDRWEIADEDVDRIELDKLLKNSAERLKAGRDSGKLRARIKVIPKDLSKRRKEKEKRAYEFVFESATWIRDRPHDHE